MSGHAFPAPPAKYDEKPWALRRNYTGPGGDRNETSEGSERQRDSSPSRDGGIGDFSGFPFGLRYPRLGPKEASNREMPMDTPKSPNENPLPFYFWPADQEMRQPSHTENSQKMTAARQPDTPGGTVALSRPRQRGQGEASGRAPW